MKRNRHKTILELIENEHIETQEQLTQRLCELHLATTQATVSRDIRELNLYKSLDADTGRYRYAAPDTTVTTASRLSSIFRDSVVSCDCAQNLVIIKTMPGLAGAAGAALDSSRNNDIVGTLSGDDTVFAAMRTASAARILAADILKLIG